jgi:RNA polymerase sigma-70 factor (ECF subfamily)
MLEDEKNLVERARGGESEAFGLLYDYYLPKIYRFVLLKVGHREEAEDLVHQTFLKAWENIEQYRSLGYPFGSWLYRIARNTVIDYYRGNVPNISIEDISQEVLSEKQTETGLLEAKMEWTKILEIIGNLNAVEQDVIIMRFVDDLTHKEIGKAIGKSEGATKIIQHRALKSLKILFEKNDRGRTY